MVCKVALYCSVFYSTKDQTTENQLRELTSYLDTTGYEAMKVFEDEVSGSKIREKRLAYNQMCKDVFFRMFETIIEWDISRFAG